MGSCQLNEIAYRIYKNNLEVSERFAPYLCPDKSPGEGQELFVGLTLSYAIHIHCLDDRNNGDASVCPWHTQLYNSYKPSSCWWAFTFRTNRIINPNYNALICGTCYEDYNKSFLIAIAFLVLCILKKHNFYNVYLVYKFEVDLTEQWPAVTFLRVGLASM